jgi:DNA-binding MarR family transcriptional regulator
MMETAVRLQRCLSRLTRRLRLERRDRQASLGRLSVLGHLHRDGPATPSTLAQAEGVQPQSLTRLLADLEAEGLALRRQDEHDRRQFLMEITPDGRGLLQRDAQDKAAWLAGAMAARLSTTEQELLRLAAQLMERLAEAPAVWGEAGSASRCTIS